MTPFELADAFRSDVDDVTEPHLWTDVDVFRYMEDAQKMFCRLTGGIPDASSSITQVPFNVSDAWLNTDPSILKIRKAYLTDTGADVEVANYEDLQRIGRRFDGTVGPLRMLIIGMEEHRARTFPLPNVAGTIQLIVDRLPLTSITGKPADALEIAPPHHEHLIPWMKAKAYSKQDSDARDDKKVAQFDAEFRAYCAAAKAEKDRAKHKTRVVVYGGL